MMTKYCAIIMLCGCKSAAMFIQLSP